MVRHFLLAIAILGVTLVPTSSRAQTIEDADFDGNGIVDFADFSAFARAFGSTESQYDLNANGRVDFSDFPLFAVFFGKEVPSGSGSRTLTVGLPGGVALELVRIEPGTFLMGTTETQKLNLKSRQLWQDLYYKDELPAHKVTLTRAYYIGIYEVTEGQWKSVMSQQQRPYHGDRPVMNVSWEDVQEFLDKLNTSAGAASYRLPTEAEWEYACQAGAETLWSFGDIERRLQSYAWYYDPTNVSEGRYVETTNGSAGNNSGGNSGILISTTYVPPHYLGPSRRQEVGGKKPNPWGIYDMHGNVSEWVQDRYSEGYYRTSPKTDPTGPGTQTGYRVVRGGCYSQGASWLRSACREPIKPSEGFDTIGFRLVREIQ
ncbi:MAG: SUMF1/EgtB/PvdO family nonheme iron enzyme [Candidatus Latescibacteria bacterium]|jgi:formylglycine-generating enzyme required for sulfatase activity|nr:SUMF1/EgtB/PvdO family nonheme iron enzyme [Candidatus Latescibacterota bacterium]